MPVCCSHGGTVPPSTIRRCLSSSSTERGVPKRLRYSGERAGVEMQREQLALDQVGLGRLAQPDRDVGLAHGEVELLLGGDQRDADLGIEVEELAEPRRQPVDADAERGRHLQLAVRPLAGVGQLGARGLELHEHFVRGAVEQLALFGEDQPARVAVKQRDAELLFERADLPRHRRLRQPELLAGMREAAGLGGGVEDLQLVPVHGQRTTDDSRRITEGSPDGQTSSVSVVRPPSSDYSAATRGSASPCAARNFSASSAAMQPRPAAVTAWR